MPIEFKRLSSLELASLPKEKTVFFFPVAPLEDHGPHLPLGLDLEEAEHLCQLTAEHLERTMPEWLGVIMPPAPLGLDSNTTHIAITVRPYVLRDWLVDSCRSLMRNGFVHFVCFSGHLGPRQLTAIEEAGKIIQRSGKISYWKNRAFGQLRPAPYLVSASSALVNFQDVLKSPFWPDPIEHGGERDTSIALQLKDKLAQPRYRSLPELKPEVSRWLRNLKRRRGQLSGYWGDPSKADLEKGESELNQILEKLFPKLRAVWEGSNPQSLFRSWYSIFPPNKSFFKAWILVILIILLISAWAVLNSLSFDLH